MNERQYDRMMKIIVRGLQGVMILIAATIPTICTVHSSILNRVLEKRMTDPHTYFLYELLYAEWILGLLLCLFINFSKRRIFAAENAKYVRRVGISIICKDFIYIPFDAMANNNVSFQFKFMTWIIGATVIMLSYLFDAPDDGMEYPKLKQVVGPPVVTIMICFLVLIEGVTGWPNKGNEDDDKFDRVESFVEDIEEESEQEITLSGEDLESVKTDFSKEEAAKVTEITVYDVADEKFDEKQEMSINYLSKETRMVLDLSNLSHFPNLQTLTILPSERMYYGDSEDENENDKDAYYYYTLDARSLSKLHGLKELSMKYMNITDLSFLKDGSIKRLTLEECNYTEAVKESYSHMSKISSICINGESVGIKLGDMLEKTDNLSELEIMGSKWTDANAFKCLKNPERLEKLVLEVNKNDHAFYDTLLQPLRDLKDLCLTFDVEYEGKSKKIFEIPVVGTLTSLEQLTIKGDEHMNWTDEYDSDLYSSVSEGDGPVKRMKRDGTFYTFDIEKNQYRDYSYLKTLKNLKSLTMEHAEMTDTSFLSELSNLTKLSIANNLVSDITPLHSLVKLEELDVSCNFISDITELSGMTDLKKLSIGNNKISSIESIRNMTKLESFDASSGYYDYESPKYDADRIAEEFYGEEENNRFMFTDVSTGYNPRSIDDINENYLYDRNNKENYNNADPFSFMNGTMSGHTRTAYSYVTLEDYEEGSIWEHCKNTIEELSPLSNAKNLVFLDVSGNKVTDLYPVKDLTKLQFLSCMRNEIKDTSMITAKEFRELTHLYLSQNPIRDGAAIESFRGWRSEIPQLQYYMTPYYNRKHLELVEPRTSRFHLEVLGIDLINVIMNIGTGEELYYGK